MAEDWYRSRTPRNPEAVGMEVRISLLPGKMERFDDECRRLSWSRSKLASALISIVLEKCPDPEHLVQQTRDGLVLLADLKEGLKR